MTFLLHLAETSLMTADQRKSFMCLCRHSFSYYSEHTNTGFKETALMYVQQPRKKASKFPEKDITTDFDAKKSFLLFFFFFK